jgi:hypothetical protein
MKTFKEIDNKSHIVKRLKKAGLSLAIIFSKDDIRRFKLKYDDEINLDNACLVSD